MTSPALSDLGRLALDAAMVGAGVARDGVDQKGLSVSYKTSHRDLVTEVDRAAEAAIIQYLQRHRPDDAILGEEGGLRTGHTDVRWIIDPIDGTANFVRGRNDFATAVAVEVSGTLAAGAIVRPVSGEWAAGDRTGVVANTGRADVSQTQQLSQSLVSISVALDGDRRRVTFGLLQRLLPDVQDFRRTGSTSCDLLAVATGQLDAYVGVDTKEWDIAPGWALVQAAGGQCLRLPLAGDRQAFVVGTPAVVDQLAPLVVRHADALVAGAELGTQPATDPARRAAVAFPRSAPVADNPGGGQGRPTERAEGGGRPHEGGGPPRPQRSDGTGLGRGDE